MADPQPPRPAPTPPPDRSQIERLNTLYDLTAVPPRSGARGLLDRARSLIAPLLARQQAFNAVLVDHLNRNDLVGLQAHQASERTILWLQQTVQATIERLDAAFDELQRYHHALAARERRSDAAVAMLTAAHEELRASLGVLHQATQHIRRQVEKLAVPGSGFPVPGSQVPGSPAPEATTSNLGSYKYVGFEDQFRGSQDDIRTRVAEYLEIFRGAQDVLDIGCGRGEFLSLLREQGVRARGIDLNGAMVDVCRQHGLDASEADALAYLRAQPDGSLGGIFAAQVIEHLEPGYLTNLLDAAFDKLRPGAPIVLETINPACWFAFFESYIRDLTHVRAIHPDTLKYLLIATGFQNVDVRYRAPYPEHEKLQPLPPQASLGDSVDTLNANVEKINRLLFTYLDYAAIARHP
jgi:2-polyprenyl-3-methyl-5-hydroxy-6-metoxy-1,4-benzoquinol methylase